MPNIIHRFLPKPGECTTTMPSCRPSTHRFLPKPGECTTMMPACRPSTHRFLPKPSECTTRMPPSRLSTHNTHMCLPNPGGSIMHWGSSFLYLLLSTKMLPLFIIVVLLRPFPCAGNVSHSSILCQFDGPNRVDRLLLCILCTLWWPYILVYFTPHPPICTVGYYVAGRSVILQ